MNKHQKILNKESAKVSKIENWGDSFRKTRIMIKKAWKRDKKETKRTYSPW